jgi:hypothetical protein
VRNIGKVHVHCPQADPMEANIGIIDSNVRKFMALPFTVLVATSALAYEAYMFSAVCAVFAAYSLFSGVIRFSLLYRVMGWSTVGGPHRANSDSRARGA